MDKNFYWLALSKVKGIGSKTLIDISNRNKETGISIEEFWNLKKSRMNEEYAIRNSVIEEIIRKGKNSADVNALQRELDNKMVKVITLEDELFPARLKEMAQPPFILYAYGNLNLLNKNSVAIVGSRTISNEGLALSYKFSNLLLEQGITVLKGDTRDIDTIAHIAAKNTKGFELTVLSEGILTSLNKLEKKNRQIDTSKTLILSFTDPNLHWKSYVERKRNQLVFSLSDDIIVVEAREGGIIMDESIKAIEKSKKLFVVRYEEYPPNVSANKFLIEKGAKPIGNVDSTLNLAGVINSVTGVETIRKVGQKKELGQYFTPQTVVEFMYDIIKTLWRKEKPKIIDTACGEGIFLKYALEQGITDGDNLYGCDIDAGVREKWNAFGGLSNRMKLFVHNGLLDGKEFGIERDKFDLVIGNPPYGGTGLGELAQLLKEDKTKPRKVSSLHLFKKESEIKKKELVAEKESIYSAPISNERKRELILLANALGEFYETWKKGDIIEITGTGKQETVAPGLFEGLGNMKSGKKKVDLIVERIQKAKLLGKGKEQLHLSPKELKKLISYPIEVLFLERFLQLAKPGGYVAIIIPDGILANINLQYIREWIFDQARVFAIVSLPRETFKHIGTTAKTSIIFMQKFNKEQTFGSTKNLPIFMASADYVGINHAGENDLPEISRGFKKFRQGKRIKEGHSSPMVTRATGEDVLKVHRLDPEYWDPKYKKMIRVMKKNHKVKSFEDFISFITYGGILVGRKRKFAPKGVYYVNQINVRNTGVDLFLKTRYISKKDRRNQSKYKPLKQDILFNRDQIGTIGRCFVFMEETAHYAVNDHVDIIRVQNINSYYVAIFLLTQYGQKQIERLSSGVSGIVGITFPQIKSIQIPILPDIVQKDIEREYKKMSRWHNKAMDVKKKLIEGGLSNKEAEEDDKYQRNIKKAEAMLKDLIKKTEEIIEGKRKKL